MLALSIGDYARRSLSGLKGNLLRVQNGDPGIFCGRLHYGGLRNPAKAALSPDDELTSATVLKQTD
jgi:hypothetical protein